MIDNLCRIKICGLTRAADIEAVNETMPDYVGFVFADSRRRITPSHADKLSQKLAGGIIPVGVFVDENPEIIAEIAENGIIDVIQLHGREGAEYIRKLKSICGKPIIKALFPPFDKTPCTTVDYFLLDSGAGSGVCFDWNMIKIKTPFFLAGGINETNIKAAIEQCKPYAVDISSGVETDGKKDPEKIKRLIRSVRNG